MGAGSFVLPPVLQTVGDPLKWRPPNRVLQLRVSRTDFPKTISPNCASFKLNSAIKIKILVF